MATAPRAIRVQRPALYPLQLRAIYAPERYSLIEASTKSGKTYGCMVWLTELCTQAGDGHNFWWVAPILAQAKIAYRRIRRQVVDQLPEWAYSLSDGELTITFADHGTMWFKGGDHPDSLYGEDVYGAVIDEATRCKDDVYYAVRSTLTATGGPIRIIGNVKGRKNWAYRMARLAEDGDPDMCYTKITALDAVAAGVLDAAEIDDARRKLPENVFRELYLAEPSDDGGNPFGLDSIRQRIRPLSTAPPACFGIDLAKSVDWTVVIGLDAQNVVCLCERWQGPWQDTITRIVQIVGTVRALVDSTGVGDPVLEALQADGRRNYEGFRFSSPSKQQLMEGLAVDIQQGHISYPEGVILNELEDFEYVYSRTGVRYSAPEGMHDDAVCALALAAAHARDKFRMFREEDIQAAMDAALASDEALFA